MELKRVKLSAQGGSNVHDNYISWNDVEYIDSPPFSYESNRITVEESGVYEIATQTYHHGYSRNNPVSIIRVNGSDVEGRGGSGYTRDGDGHDHASNHCYTIKELSAGDYVEIYVFSEGDGHDAEISDDDSSVFTIKKLPRESVGRKVTGEESGIINTGNIGTLAITRLESEQTLDISTATLSLVNGQAAPTDLNMDIVVFDNNGKYEPRKNILSGDGSSIYDGTSGDPVAKYINTSPSAETVGIIVDNNTGSDQEVMGQVYGDVI